MTLLTREQVREIDRRAIEVYHTPGIVLMENASRAAADVACEMLRGGDHGAARVEDAQVLILCGGGNNGGDGLAIARHLHNRGVAVSIALTIDPQRYQGDALTNWKIVQAMKLPIAPVDPAAIAFSRARLIIDAIFGTGLSQPPRDPFPAIASAVARSAAPVLAIDVPSGLDCNTGRPLAGDAACIRATRTITFVAEKTGFAAATARAYLGAVTVGDIGCPRELIEAVAATSSTAP